MMTKEEAQIIIGNIPIKPEVLDDCYDITEYQEAKAMAIEALAQQPCDNAINREEAIRIAEQGQIQGFEWQLKKLCTLPSVKPKFTDDEIQKMQELEQAQLEKAYELGKAEIQPCEDCVNRTAAIDVVHKYFVNYLKLNDDICLDGLRSLPPVTSEPFINKPCISEGVCHEDKIKVLDKIRSELIQSIQNGTLKIENGNEELFRIIDKYKIWSEEV